MLDNFNQQVSFDGFAQDILDGDVRIVLDEFLRSNDALVLEIGFPVGEAKLSQDFGLSVNSKTLANDVFDVGYRYAQHQKLRFTEAQDIIDCLAYIQDQNSDALNSVAISYKGILCPYLDFVLEDSEEMFLKADEDNVALDDGSVIEDSCVDVDAQNFPRLRIIGVGQKKPDAGLVDNFRRVLSTSDTALKSSIAGNLESGKSVAVIAMPHSEDRTVHWLLDGSPQVAFASDVPALAAE